jgi:hypothetical protein
MYISWTFDLFFVHWLNFVVIGYVFLVLVNCTKEESGNPADELNNGGNGRCRALLNEIIDLLAPKNCKRGR